MLSVLEVICCEARGREIVLSRVQRWDLINTWWVCVWPLDLARAARSRVKMAFFVPNLGNRTNIVPSRIRYTGAPVTTYLKYCLHLQKANVVSNHRYHNRQHYYHYHYQKLFYCHCHIYSRIVIILLMLSDSYRLTIQLFHKNSIATALKYFVMLFLFRIHTSICYTN